MTKTMLLLAATTALFPVAAQASGSSTISPYSLTSTSYTQNFDGLASSGAPSSVLPAGFQIIELGTSSAADGLYVVGTGSSNSGGAYSFGATGSTDRALGSLASGTGSPIYLGGVFTNGLSSTITSLNFAYTGEQWRAGNSTDDGLTFQYSLNATALDNGTWVSVAALDFLPLVLSGDTALNGNANSTSISALINGLSIAAGSSFAFRWTDLNSSGNDHGLGIDNLSITATTAVAAVPEPASWAMLVGGFAVIGGAMRTSRRRLSATFA